MNVVRDTTGQWINHIFNDPTVKPFIIDDERYLDLGKIASDPKGYCIIGEPPFGAYVLWPIVDGVYEFHVGVLPQGRGQWAVDFSAATIDYMFCATDAIELITRIPQGSLPSLALARHFALHERWRCPAIRFRGRTVPYTVLSVTLFDWIPSDDEARNAFLSRMHQMGMEKKATAWYQRWALLSPQEKQ